MLRALTFTVALVVLLAGCASPTGGGGKVSFSDSPLYGKFVWRDLITDDVAAAREFYSVLFDWSYEDTVGSGGNDYTLIQDSDGMYVGGIVQLDDPETDEDYSRWLNYLSVPDVDQAVETMVAAGGEVLLPARELGRIARAAVVKDPQGAVLGLVRSKVGDPDDPVLRLAGHVSWNELLSDDSQQAAVFYSDLVGYQLETLSRNGGEYIMLNAQGRARAGIQDRPSDDLQPFWLTHFGVYNLTLSAARVHNEGGRILVPPSPEVRRGTMSVVVDPTGAVFGLQNVSPRGGAFDEEMY